MAFAQPSTTMCATIPTGLSPRGGIFGASGMVAPSKKVLSAEFLMLSYWMLIVLRGEYVSPALVAHVFALLSPLNQPDWVGAERSRKINRIPPPATPA